MIYLFAFIGLALPIWAGLMAVGYFIHWVTDEYDYILPWLVTCLFYAATLAVIVVSRMYNA